MKKIAVLISGSGSNLEAIINACNKNIIDGDVVKVISNNPKAYGPGTNLDFMYTMRDAPNSQVVGQTVFGTA